MPIKLKLKAGAQCSLQAADGSKIYMNTAATAAALGWGLTPSRCVGDTKRARYVIHDPSGTFYFADVIDQCGLEA